MSKIRIHRFVTAKPGCLQELMRVNFDACELMKKQTGLHADIFCSRFTQKSIGTQHMYIDFDSLAQYEEVFLHGLLRSKEYLKTANTASSLIVEQPIDELMVRLSSDDFFMNENFR